MAVTDDCLAPQLSRHRAHRHQPWDDEDPRVDRRRTRHPRTIRHLAEAPLILYDAHYGWRDATRRQLAERAQLAGVRLDPLIEVEHVESAPDLVAQGIGDTIASRAVAEGSAFPPGLTTAPFADPMYDTIALIQRRDRSLSPATSELARLAEAALRSLALPGRRVNPALARRGPRAVGPRPSFVAWADVRAVRSGVVGCVCH